MDAKFTIIIPTLADRPKELERAIDSLLCQSCGQVIPLVVLNGNRYDQDLVEKLRLRQDIRFTQIPTAGVSRARYEGRKLVDTPYFGFLDDDDEYLPDALVNRHRVFENNSDIDVVVGNGLFDAAGVQRPVWRDTEAIASNPADALTELNWLGSCSGLFKSETVGPEYFDFDYQYLEWTYLAFHLAFTRKISFVAEPTFIIYSSPNSLSSGVAYGAAYAAVLKDILAFEMPKSLQKKLWKKILSGHHNMSDYYRRRGALYLAWYYHLLSMMRLHGLLQYGLYTSKLFIRSRTINDNTRTGKPQASNPSS